MKKYWFQFIKFLLNPVLRNHKSFLAKLIGLTSRNIYLQYENVNYNHKNNGEENIFKKLSSLWEPKVFFDVGANKGSWTIMAQNICKNKSHIQCFEIIPQTFHELKKNLSLFSNITLNNIGLSDKNETFEIHYHPNHSGTTTIYTPMFFDAKENRMQVSAIKGDDYVKQHQIDKINFLKIDVEGMEPKVINGFIEMIKAKKIDVIQFEYGLINIESRFLLKDYYELFEPLGYVIGKIYPNYVNFKPYSLYDENFLGPNYLAVNKNLRNIISALK